MSLRSEYSRADVFNEEARKWEVTVFYHQNETAKVVGRESVNFEFEIKEAATRLISAHMEKVTRMRDQYQTNSEWVDGSGWKVTVTYREFPHLPSRVVGESWVSEKGGIKQAEIRIISQHMEKITRIICGQQQEDADQS